MKTKIMALAAMFAVALLSGCDKSARESREEIEAAVACMNNNDYDCSVKLLEKAVKRKKTAEAYLLLGESYRAQREATTKAKSILPKEVDSLEKSVELDNKNVRALKFLGEAQFAMGQYEAAKKTFGKIPPLNPPQYEIEAAKYMISECDRILARMAMPPPAPPAPNPGDEVEYIQ